MLTIVLPSGDCVHVRVGSEALGAVLRTAGCSLRSLRLGWNMVRMAGSVHLVSALSVNTSLVLLDLSYNSLGREGKWPAYGPFSDLIGKDHPFDYHDMCIQAASPWGRRSSITRGWRQCWWSTTLLMR